VLNQRNKEVGEERGKGKKSEVALCDAGCRGFVGVNFELIFRGFSIWL
jgi:hypothetical protein